MDDRKPTDGPARRAPTIDPEMVAAACGGDRNALNIVFGQAYPRVLRLLTHLGHDRELARELTQESLALASQRLHQLKVPTSFEPWLMQIARNTFVDSEDQPRFRRSLSLDWQLEQPGAVGGLSGPSDAIESYPERELVWQTFAQMTPAAREVIYLSRVAGYSGEEVGLILRISPSAVYQRLHRTQAEFMRIYGRLAGDSQSGAGRPE